MNLLGYFGETSIFMYIEKGGVIGYVLLVLCTIGFSLIIWKFFHISYVRIRRKKYFFIVVDEVKDISNASISMSVAKKSLDEKMSKLESGMSTIRIIAAIAPLLGLLGTVVGILNAFETISKSGMGDPSQFAGGISLALITTVMGLIIAIPHYVGYNYLIRSIDLLESIVTKEIDFIIVKGK